MALRTERRDDRGQTVVEFLGMLPILILVGLALVQFGIAAYAIQQAGTGARAAARTAGLDEPEIGYAQAGKAAMSGWLADRAAFTRRPGPDEVSVTARVPIPSVIPFVDGLGATQKTVTMPRTKESAP
ncbi:MULTISPECIES: TadE/TadG family type IV pilus assembly protein [Streptomyces]|uniref:TadE/TadG family type IV pilus assembly protein n=1 Tax=Streptomyces olivaceiscleroticus TaxID=68245 RepID=A0ABP3KYL2_9ACTN|nr:TadE family protein [Streptomyces niger]